MPKLQPWEQDIKKRVTALTDTFQYELSDSQSREILNLVLDIAKQNFIAGNRAGIAWARKNLPRSQCIYNHDHAANPSACEWHD